MSVPPPSRLREKEKALPEPPKQAAENIGKTRTEDFVDLGFKVPKRFKTDYKQAALLADCSMKEILEESFELWLREKGISLSRRK